MKEKKLIIFTDIGDTVIDESTEVYGERQGLVLRADCIPGAKEAMLELHRRGYTIVMVADGLVESFGNTMRQHGLSEIFRAKIISEDLGTHKPDARMFRAAMDALGLTDADKDRVIMVGNNLIRDIVGANRFGIRSVLLTWSKRYRMEPENEEETPTYRIAEPAELVDLAEQLEKELNV